MLERQFVDTDAARGHAGIVEQQIEPAEGFTDALEGLGHRLRLADIGGQQQIALGRRCGGFLERLQAPAQQGHAVAGAGQGLGAGPADAAAGAGHGGELLRWSCHREIDQAGGIAGPDDGIN